MDGRMLVRGALRLALRQLRPAVAADHAALRRRYRVDPDWRRIEDGHAARLGSSSTIDVAQPVGRWRDADPLRGNDAWRNPSRAFGLLLWAGAVGTAWWLGTSRGRGPLAVLHDPDPFA